MSDSNSSRPTVDLKSGALIVAGFGLFAIVVSIVVNDPTRTFPVLETQANF